MAVLAPGSTGLNARTGGGTALVQGVAPLTFEPEQIKWKYFILKTHSYDNELTRWSAVHYVWHVV